MIVGRFFCKVVSKIKQLALSKMLDRYVWMDLEMTGLDVKNDKILEIACIITTTDLNPVHDGINLVIHQPENILKSMNEWCLVHHEKTGLTKASRESNINIEEADKIVSEYIKEHTNEKGVRYLAGNSVHQDRIFIDSYLPATSSLLNYRIVDVSTIKILCQHWYSDTYSNLPKKKLVHRALDDVLGSIFELKNYQKAIFKT